MGVMWLFTLLGAVVGTCFLLSTVMGAKSAPQQAAGAAIACALCVIPYIAARAVQELRGSGPASTQVSNGAPPVASVAAAARQSSLGVGAMIIVALVIFAIFGVVALSSSGSVGTDTENPAARKACLEFKAIYDTLTTPTASQIETAAGCRAKGYW